MAQSNYLVAVVGAGPAGLYATKQLAGQGAYVFLFNRDIKPGGLAEYGIYPDKFFPRQVNFPAYLEFFFKFNR